MTREEQNRKKLPSIKAWTSTAVDPQNNRRDNAAVSIQNFFCFSSKWNFTYINYIMLYVLNGTPNTSWRRVFTASIFMAGEFIAEVHYECSLCSFIVNQICFIYILISWFVTKLAFVTWNYLNFSNTWRVFLDLSPGETQNIFLVKRLGTTGLDYRHVGTYLVQIWFFSKFKGATNLIWHHYKCYRYVLFHGRGGKKNQNWVI